MNKKSLLIFLSVHLLFALSSWSTMLPKPEYPRPQFERTDWINLNGEWTYTLDQAQSGWERGLADAGPFDGRIIVPFAPESQLSGVAYDNTDFINCIWYQRMISIPSEWNGRDIMLNFGAVYYVSEVYIDGNFVARHFGGSDSFSLDITAFVTPGNTHSLVINARSDLRSRMQPAGKQSLRQANFECMYTRTTGIWQTVWMEAVNPCSLERVITRPDIDDSAVSFTFYTHKNAAHSSIAVTIKGGTRTIAHVTTSLANGTTLSIPLRKAHLWSPEDPYLYDVIFEMSDKDGKIVDRVFSYFGMRKIHAEGGRIYLNNEPYYQRLVLDQGFYPDGIWTAPSDEALKHDIELSKSVGFNGARLHQKVFEERFHYWADHLGYLTWGEFPSWGLDANDPLAARNFLSEWTRVVERDINHPSIVTWTPFNEEFWPDEVQYPRFISDVYDITRSLDPTRLINTVSGGVHIKTDIWTYHDYEQDATILKQRLLDNGTQPGPALTKQERLRGNVGFNRPVLNSPYTFPRYTKEIPYIVDEFGGIRCMESNPPEEGSWGYGSAPQTNEEFYIRLESQVKAIMEINSTVWGYCYTQLTDVQQEQNGIFYFDRRPKFDTARLREIFGMKAP